MEPERWQQIDQLLEAALEQEESQRATFLEEACAGDETLRQEVETLLAAHDQVGDFIETPALEVAARNLAEARAQSLVGQKLGSYKILSLLGAGGMGEVYLAQDTTLARKVALKFLPEEFQQNPAARKRFLREAKSAAGLDHPFICKIYEVGEAEGKSFISMEYIQGATLQEKLAEGPIPVRNVLETAGEIADALEGAHRHGIVHLDLKPSNIMFTPEGHVKMMDFGLAKRVTLGQEQDITMALTQEGAASGTVPYMSPEQVRGQQLDTRSDIFSFGVVLYEMVTGVNPFKKGSAMDTADTILSETPPPVTRYADNVPELLQQTIRKMLAKDRKGRYQTAQALLAVLRQLNLDAASTDAAITATTGFGTGQSKSSRRWTKVGVGSLLALAVTFAGLWYSNILNDREPRAAEFALFEGAEERITLAVLPFYTVNAPEEIGFLSIGLPDAIIARLANTEQLRLRPTNAILQYENRSEDLQEVGQALKSEYVLTGTIQKVGERFRVTVQLVRTSDGSPIWSEHFDKLVSDLLELQDAISQQVVAALEIKMTAAEQERVYQRHTQNVAAYELYLQGRSHLVRQNREETLAAVEAFEGALRYDPNNALAHAGLAMASVQMLRFAAETEVESWGERAERQAGRALELDPNLAQGHEALAALYRHKEFEWDRTIEESRRTLEATPNLDLPHFYIAGAFYHLGLLELVDGELRQGQEINPMNPFEVLRTGGITALLSGKFNEAVALLEEVQHLSSRPLSDPYLAQAYYYRGEKERAEKMLAQIGGSAQAKRRGQAILASFLAAGGQRVEAEELVLEVTEGAYIDHHVAYSLGVAYAQLGDHSEALDWLRNAAETGFLCYPWYVNDPLLEPLHGDREYQAFLTKLRQSWELARDRYAPS